MRATCAVLSCLDGGIGELTRNVSLCLLVYQHSYRKICGRTPSDDVVGDDVIARNGIESAGGDVDQSSIRREAGPSRR